MSLMLAIRNWAPCFYLFFATNGVEPWQMLPASEPWRMLPASEPWHASKPTAAIKPTASFEPTLATSATDASAADEVDIKPVLFDAYFHDKALRLDLYQGGDAKESATTLHNLFEEPSWPENPQNLLSPFPYGKFLVQVRDSASNRVIYTKGFDSLFAEYATTKPAILGNKKIFQATTRIPLPKASVQLTIEKRNGDNSKSIVFSEKLAPTDLRIQRESSSTVDKPFDIQIKGHPHDCLDLVFLSEGYSASQEEKFKSDVQKMTDHLLSLAPYKSSSDRINIRGVFRASEQSGTDEPNKGVFRNTALNSSFNTLGIDRYLLVEDNHRMHQMAACVPYDSIVVLVNTTTYGGGAICLDYCVCSTDSRASLMVFVHELGHGLAYLADEYVGNVTYNDIYPDGIEPVEPNITRQLDPDKIKWKSFLSRDAVLPTKPKPENKNERTVGAFEGGGYLSKGMYRAQASCLMGSANPKEVFCVVCEDAIQRTIDYYSPIARQSK